MALVPLNARVPPAILVQLEELAVARRRADPEVTRSRVAVLALQRGIQALASEEGGTEGQAERALAEAKRARATAERAHYEAKKAVTAETEARKLAGNSSTTVPVTTST